MQYSLMWKGDVIFRYGDVPDKLYIILAGSVKFYVPFLLDSKEDEHVAETVEGSVIDASAYS